MWTMLLLLGSLSSAAETPEGRGWRGDGSGLYPEARVPQALSPQAATWTVPLPARGNASPVLFHDMVCVTAEPITLACYEASSGRPRWSTTHAYTDTLTGEAAIAWQAELAALPGVRARMLVVQERIASLRRSARASSSTEALTSELTALTSELGALKQRLDAAAPKLTPDTQDLVGYASPTPVSTDQHLYALFGQGVVSKLDRTGRRVWSVWLGPGVRPMRGHEAGTTASPLLVDDLLIVPHGALHALDAGSGKVRWRVAPYADFGTPAVVELPGMTVLVTPDGRAIRASDGAVLATGLADVWYGGPTAAGDLVWWVGGHGQDHDPNNNHGWAWRLSPDGQGGLRTERLWERTLPFSARIYVAPLAHAGRLYTLDHATTLHTLDAATGAVLSSLPLGEQLRSAPYPNPSLVGGELVLQGQAGELVVLSPGPKPAATRAHQIGRTTLASPAWSARGAWVRTYNELLYFAR